MSYNTINNTNSNIGYDNVSSTTNLPLQESNNQFLSSSPMGNSSGTFATLDVAFSPSATMSEFENRIKGKKSLSPMATTNIRCIDNDYISPQSEEKINNGVDQMMGAFYNRSNDLANQISDGNVHQYSNLQNPVVKNGIQFPLNRSQQYNSQQLGTDLMEKFNGSEIKDYQQQCKFSYWKFVLLVLAIIIILFVFFRIIKQNKKAKTTTTSTTKISTSGVEKLNQAFKRGFMCKI
jgi:large-conductance mechanosensitive channel